MLRFVNSKSQFQKFYFKSRWYIFKAVDWSNINAYIELFILVFTQYMYICTYILKALQTTVYIIQRRSKICSPEGASHRCLWCLLLAAWIRDIGGVGAGVGVRELVELGDVDPIDQEGDVGLSQLSKKDEIHSCDAWWRHAKTSRDDVTRWHHKNILKVVCKLHSM
jgi:hypothetical protein